MFDSECLFTPYLPPPSSSRLKPQIPEGDLLNLDNKRKTGFSRLPGARRKVDGEDDDFEEEEWVPDVFLFEYGTVVIWGMTEKEEKAFLKSL